MHYIAPLVIILGLSGALYKTQEVFSMDAYTINELSPYIRAAFGRREFGGRGKGGNVKGEFGAGQDRAAYLAALKAQSEASAAKRDAAKGTGV